MMWRQRSPRRPIGAAVRRQSARLILNRAADLYEQNFGEFFAVLTREAGKTPADAIAELREAVDFLRYYAAASKALAGRLHAASPPAFRPGISRLQSSQASLRPPRRRQRRRRQTGRPDANCGASCRKHLHAAGVPRSVLQLLPGRGSVVGARLVADPRISAVCFTGSTATAQTINASMAATAPPDAPLVAETGGLNAMIVDSTALPEQAVRDIVNSSFRSAGQRCSALRILYLQEDIAGGFLEMLFGAMDELSVGNPWDHATDVGPVISASARQEMLQHIVAAKTEGRLLKQSAAPREGHFVGPAVIKVRGMVDMAKEIFGPVLHVATFKAADVGRIVEEINASRYGLTFGLHTRIDARVEDITTRLNVGNIYVNRNQIGAIVGSQPFGGEALSGTGPKAGGPHYVRRFAQGERVASSNSSPRIGRAQGAGSIHALPSPSRTALEATDLPGPTGESNRLSLYPRGVLFVSGQPLRQPASRQKLRAPAVVHHSLFVPALRALMRWMVFCRVRRWPGCKVSMPWPCGAMTMTCARHALRLRSAAGSLSRSSPCATCGTICCSNATSASTPQPPAAMPACSRDCRAYFNSARASSGASSLGRVHFVFMLTNFPESPEAMHAVITSTACSARSIEQRASRLLRMASARSARPANGSWQRRPRTVFLVIDTERMIPRRNDGRNATCLVASTSPPKKFGSGTKIEPSVP